MIDFSSMDAENPPYSDAVRVHLEKALGIELPDSYVSLMKKWNGGSLGDSFQIPVLDAPETLGYYLGDGFWSVYEIPGISDDAGHVASLLYAATTAHEWGVPEKVIAFCGDGHTWIAFDYRDLASVEPTIIFIETDELQFHVLARSFQELMDRLIPHASVFDPDGNIIYKA